ncbi:MAG: orotate phosphoribosyltransferase [Acidobacteriota bacterium]|jgi:orotate phosphoribosyltransferase|nr:orotate phosphoribosyltransferase [Acidobacteriota bacterium]
MIDDVLKSLPAKRGHFLLESGYHTDLWLTLDALFVTPHEIAPRVAALAELLRPYSISAICGPLMGGAFLAHALAAHMNLRFYFTQQVPVGTDAGLFAAQYRLPPELRRRVCDERIAIVDDCISAGSSVRATAAALTEAGAQTIVVGTILLLGDEAVEHFSARGVSLVALAHQKFNLWASIECPLCRAGAPLENPVAFT